MQTEGSIQTIVGKTFDELILSSPQNIFLEVFIPIYLQNFARPSMLKIFTQKQDDVKSFISVVQQVVLQSKNLPD